MPPAHSCAALLPSAVADRLQLADVAHAAAEWGKEGTDEGQGAASTLDASAFSGPARAVGEGEGAGGGCKAAQCHWLLDVGCVVTASPAAPALP